MDVTRHSERAVVKETERLNKIIEENTTRHADAAAKAKDASTRLSASESKITKLKDRVFKLTTKLGQRANKAAEADLRKAEDALKPKGKGLWSKLFRIGKRGADAAGKLAKPVDIAMNIVEFVQDPTIETGTSIAGSTVGAVAGAKFGAALGAPLGPVGVVVGGLIGGAIGGIIGSEAGRELGKGIRFALQTARDSPVRSCRLGSDLLGLAAV